MRNLRVEYLPLVALLVALSLVIGCGGGAQAQGLKASISNNDPPPGGGGGNGGGGGGTGGGGSGGGPGAPNPQPADPGVRSAGIGAGQPLASVAQTPGASAFFSNGLTRFQEIEVVTSSDPTANIGLGPRFNSNQCSSCHAQPAIGGSSPSASVYPQIGMNPQTEVFNLAGANNTLPS